MRLGGGELTGEETEFFEGRRGQDFSVARGTLVDAEAKSFRDQRLDAVEEKIVKLGTGLASDLDGVFETGGGDQSGAGSFALEQRVGADGGAVEEDEVVFGGNLFRASTMAWEGSAGVEKTLSMRRRPVV